MKVKNQKTKQLTVIEKKPEPTGILAVIERAAINPKVDVEKMQKLLDMQIQITNKQAEISFERDFVEMQAELPVIDEKGSIKDKGGKIVSTYAEFEDINEAVKPILKEHGFGLRFHIEQHDNLIKVTAILSHRSGHSDRTSFVCNPDKTGFKNEVQGIGSGTSYGMRYTLRAILNISSRAPQDKDNDGGLRVNEHEARPDEFSQLVQEGQAPKPVLDNKIAPQDAGGEWDGKTLVINSKEVKKNFDSPEAAADYLSTVVRNHKTHASRSTLVNDNLALIRALAKAGKADVIQGLHALVDAGEGGDHVEH